MASMHSVVKTKRREFEKKFIKLRGDNIPKFEKMRKQKEAVYTFCFQQCTRLVKIRQELDRQRFEKKLGRHLEMLEVQCRKAAVELGVLDKSDLPEADTTYSGQWEPLREFCKEMEDLTAIYPDLSEQFRKLKKQIHRYKAAVKLSCPYPPIFVEIYDKSTIHSPSFDQRDDNALLFLRTVKVVDALVKKTYLDTSSADLPRQPIDMAKMRLRLSLEKAEAGFYLALWDELQDPPPVVEPGKRRKGFRYTKEELARVELLYRASKSGDFPGEKVEFFPRRTKTSLASKERSLLKGDAKKKKKTRPKPPDFPVTGAWRALGLFHLQERMKLGTYGEGGTAVGLAGVVMHRRKGFSALIAPELANDNLSLEHHCRKVFASLAAIGRIEPTGRTVNFSAIDPEIRAKRRLSKKERALLEFDEFKIALEYQGPENRIDLSKCREKLEEEFRERQSVEAERLRNNPPDEPEDIEEEYFL